MKRASILLILASAAIMRGQQPGAGLDNGGNGYLNGIYFFRWVNFSSSSGSGVFTQATAVYGVIAFDGRGNYNVRGQITDSRTSSGQAGSYTASGAYVVASSGLAEISSPLISGITLHAMVGSEAVVGSINFPGRYDLFIAIPAPAANASTKSLQGTYQTGSLDFPGGNDKMARSAFFTLTPDGAGSFGAFTPSGSAANLPVPPAVTIAGATYSVNSDRSGSATFPLPSGTGAAQALVGGSKLIYVSADGAVLLGGSGTGFDMIIGLQKLTIDPATAYPGLYYYAGLYYDLSSGSADLYNEIGGRNVQSSAASVSFSENESIGGNLYLTDVNSSGPAEVPGSDGVAAQDSYYRVAGAGGQMYFAAGRQTRYYLAVGVKTRPLTLSGVFLSPYGVVDAGNFGPPPVFVAPGEFLSLFGSGFASASETASSYPLPMSLNGVQVRINGRLAPLSFAGPNQINAVVPYATTEPYASVQIQANGTSSNTVTLYTRDAHAAILATTHTNYSVVSQSNGAKPGETVVVFLTGLGATSPPVSDGIAVPLSPFSVVPASTGIYASVGGYDADLIFAGLTPGAAGLYQLNLEIPRSAVSGAADLLIGNAEDRVISDPASGALLHYTAGFATYSSVFIAQ